MLASGAILDYGSIRQFAAKHGWYRFKDVDRIFGVARGATLLGAADCADICPGYGFHLLW